MAAPAPVMADGGCQDCGPGVHAMGYEGYPASASYGGEIVGGAYDKRRGNFAGVCRPRRRDLRRTVRIDVFER